MIKSTTTDCMTHPYATFPKELIIEAAKMFLPSDRTDWNQICQRSIDWINDRAEENYLGNEDWFAWRANDPIHVAVHAIEETGYEYWAVTHKKWFDRLFAINHKRYQDFIDQEEKQRLGDAT